MKSIYAIRIVLMSVLLIMFTECSFCFAEEQTDLNDTIYGAESFRDTYNRMAENLGMRIRLTECGSIGGNAKGAAFGIKDTLEYWHSPLCIDTFGDDARLKRVIVFVDLGTKDKNGMSNYTREINRGREMMTVALCSVCEIPFSDSWEMVELGMKQALDSPAHYPDGGVCSKTYPFHITDKNGRSRNFVFSADHLSCGTPRSDMLTLMLIAYKR